jgi:hypothetical protein
LPNGSVAAGEVFPHWAFMKNHVEAIPEGFGKSIFPQP